MKHLFFFSCLIYFLDTLAFESFSGYIINQNQQKFIKTTSGEFSLLAEDSILKAQILKLNTNDFISAVGTKKSPNSFVIESIDYIGLNRFLGLWMSSLGLLQVNDFSHLHIYNSQANSPRKSSASNLNYSITPGQGDSWVLFLSDDSQIYYSDLYMAENKALIRFYSTTTGAFINEVTMNKLVP